MEPIRVPYAKVLPRMMRGQEALDELGENIRVVAERNRMTVEGLRTLLLSSESAHVATNGTLAFVDAGPNGEGRSAAG